MSGYLNDINLLYVEDSKSIREILSRRLERKVNKLIVAVDGEEGYNKFLEEKPDMILTDVTMPKMSGIEMARKIKETDPNIPIIILSAHSESKFLLEAIELGISGYLLKPVDREKMNSQLEVYAKIACLQKINKIQQEQILSQKEILQNIMDVEDNIKFVTDFNQISFTNTAFLKFFNVISIDEFSEKYKHVEEVFIKHDDYIYPQLVESCNKDLNETCFGELFYTKLNEIDEAKRVVLMLDSKFEPKTFYINISVINEEKHLYLINLTDITKMTIERVKTEHKAYFDGLTGIFNRNKLEESFKQELLRVKRYNHPLSIAIIDIDHFKRFNDTHGHLVGDEVLIMLAQNVERKIRDTDVFARWGGEEFVIIFVETNAESAYKTAEHLREYIEQLEHKTAGKVTASFGITQYKDGDTLASLFKRCDDALYLAKENGRNRVEVK